MAANAELAIAELGLGRLAIDRARSAAPSPEAEWRIAREALTRSVAIWRRLKEKSPLDRESNAYWPGGQTAVAETPWGRLGMSVCYDVRFPHLYRALAQAGADFISVPSAFTRPTGEAHWQVLLRARAIETGCYILAPAQCGEHAEGRRTWGHSLIVSPWGEIVAEAGEEPAILTARIDPAAVAAARRMLPALTHDRPLALPAAAETLRRAGE